MFRKAGGVVVSASLLFGATAGVAEAADVDASAASTRILCETTTSDADPFYDGASASQMYDNRFAAGPNFSGAELAHFTPQGAFWLDNGVDGRAMLLATTYNDDASIAHIVGLDPTARGENGTVGTVRIDKSHVGGIAVHGDWVFVAGPKKDGGKQHTIQKYRLSDVKQGIEKGKPGTDTKPRIHPVGADRNVYGSSFLTVDGDHLYAGLFKDHREQMYKYAIGSDGSLETVDGPWEIPAKTQGVSVNGDEFVYSTSSGRNNRSNVYSVSNKTKDLDKAAPRCFRAPSLSQAIASDTSGNAHLLFESGSHKYDGTDGDRARNVIDGFHRAKLSTLESLKGGKLALGTLHCVETEDWVGEDEISVRVEKQAVWDGNMSEGEKQKIDEKPMQFTGRVEIALYEKDSPDGDDFLGKKVLEPGDDDGILTFEKDGAKYRLSYKTS
ncbi:hypothetical protein [Allosaccharopolyspora coralli]|uniref:hypothetical protein n=1 Tax=Allosaccharopolyspora coralli TaxID=2665642 RepID=UPI0016523B5F|nr:hypothetical protein [Allosaccharopolyspora coralli]